MTKMSVRSWMAALSAALILSIGCSIAVAGAFSNKWRNVGFETPVEFSKPIDAGMDAVVFTTPPTGKLGEGKMEITLVAVPKDMKEGLGNSDAEVLNYIKTTFLGTGAAAEKSVERPFLGKKVVGEALSSKIPRKIKLEVFLIPMPNGDSMAVAFSLDPTLPPGETEALAEMTARTFKVIGNK